MSTGRARSRLSRVAAVSAGLAAALLGAPAVGAVPQVVQDQAQFQATDVAAVPFADDADTAFAVRPFAGLVGHSCTDAAAGIDLGGGDRGHPRCRSVALLCGRGLERPGRKHLSPADRPDHHRVGRGRLRADLRRAGQRPRARAPDQLRSPGTHHGDRPRRLDDSVQGRRPRDDAQLVGVRGPTAPEGIRAVSIDTTGGALQNTGITGIAVARTPPVAVMAEVAVDIKPGNARNCVNPRAAGVVPVAVLSENGFDARTLDAGTVALEGAPARPRAHRATWGRRRTLRSATAISTSSCTSVPRRSSPARPTPS